MGSAPTTAARTGLIVIGFANAGFGARFLPSGCAAVDLVAMVVLLESEECAWRRNPQREGAESYGWGRISRHAPSEAWARRLPAGRGQRPRRHRGRLVVSLAANRTTFRK